MTTYNAESDIAVLKEQIASLTARVGQVGDAQASNFGALNARFDTLTPLVQDITRLQERHASHKLEIDHAFELLRAQDVAASTLEGKLGAYCTSHADAHTAINKRLDTQRGWQIGVGSTTAVALGLLIWVANLFITKIEDIDTLAHANQINLMQHKLDEAGKGN